MKVLYIYISKNYNDELKVKNKYKFLCLTKTINMPNTNILIDTINQMGKYANNGPSDDISTV